MKTKINYYTIKLIKNNLVFIIILFFSILLTGYISYSFYQEYTKNNDLVEQTKLEIQNLQKRKNNLENLVSANYLEVKDFNYMLNQLIPSAEDYFSIIISLDKLSQQTGFIINNYVIKLDNSSANMLTLGVDGSGDINSFLKFLEDYNFSSGRLITMNNFDFNNKGVQYHLSLNFYNKQVSEEVAELSAINEERLQYMRDLLSKVSFLIKDREIKLEGENVEKFDYPIADSVF